ncbi:SDR family NAD(P)-dependent oxidoreductase [Streptomyces tsukubensis]|uniref:Probable oxidoreductase n=1 Tax=Streptomyces tsukubensis TaxID=83656 RepID=A0A1V4AC40_9ACTN|nr:SDR family NAD(P)-dependent oxidoreductase [Streptomyces tsukubensis]OON81446.1 oxidoreductase [Streptomyces tsukubensis]QFR95425.1 SDR family NAD(P)-dependent oxidoreductase [Streptomyces tsukubensis]
MARITTPFGATSTAAEVIADTDLTGSRAVVTGATSGIGVETARALASAGAEVTLAVRDTEAGDRTAADITATTGNSRVLVSPLDLADRSSVKAFARSWHGPLQILVQNAGVMFTPFERTPEGRELQFATNYLGHFELVLALHAALAEAGGHPGGARVVSLSSSGHLLSPVVFDDLDFRFRPYDPLAAYGQSKTANILFAVEASRRWTGDGIQVNAVMPGNIRTNLQRHMTPSLLENLGNLGDFRRLPFKSPEQGAATPVLVAASPLLEGIGGRYFEDCAEALVVEEAGGWAAGVAPYALDAVNASRLWEDCAELLGG